MDIWAWFVDAVRDLMETDPQVAVQLMDFPSQVVDDDVGAIEAAYPQLLAAAWGARSPWLEVFVRHWYLQSVVFHRRDVARALPEAVALLERAHRPDAERCPQSVCVSQDLCAAYGYADGPGYALERLQVSHETLGRIDPKWPCWTCIAGEHAHALVDAGRHEDALEWIEVQTDAIRNAGRRSDPGDFAFAQATALMALGRTEEALSTLDAAAASQKGRAFERRRRVERARVLVALGRHAEAAEAVPPWEEVRGSAVLFDSYAVVLAELVRAGIRPWAAEEVAALAEMTGTLGSLGCPRAAVEVGLLAADLAAERQGRELGEAFLARVEAQIARLERPLGAPEALAARRRAVAAVPVPEVAEDPEEAVARLQQGEVRLDLAMATLRRHPRGELLHAIVDRWEACGFRERARAMVAEAWAAAPDDGELYLALGRLLLADGDLEAAERHVAAGLGASAADPGDVPGHARWLGSRLAELRGDLDRAAALVQELLDHRPEWCSAGVPARLASILRRVPRLEEALTATERAIGMVPRHSDPARSLHWDRMVLATRLGRWQAVRDSAAALHLPVDPGEGPIEESWGVIRIAWPGEPRALWADRTGPVTARILSIVGPNAGPERHGDLVVFDPKPLAGGGGDDEVPVFRAEEVLSPGGAIAVALDGVHPGEAAMQALRTRLEAAGATLMVVSGDRYRLTDPASGLEVQGVYAKVATRDRAALPEIREAFAAVRDGAPGPVVWIALAEALGLEQEAAEHRAIAESWGM